MIRLHSAQLCPGDGFAVTRPFSGGERPSSGAAIPAKSLVHQPFVRVLNYMSHCKSGSARSSGCATIRPAHIDVRFSACALSQTNYVYPEHYGPKVALLNIQTPTYPAIVPD